jgi:hypothetical protein
MTSVNSQRHPSRVHSHTTCWDSIGPAHFGHRKRLGVTVRTDSTHDSSDRSPHFRSPSRTRSSDMDRLLSSKLPGPGAEADLRLSPHG